MYEVIKSKIKRDKAFPERAYTLGLYQRILEGNLYNCFRWQYHDEYVGGAATPRYVEEIERAPTSNTGLNLMRTAVEQSVNFLFGEDRFPKILCDDDTTKQFIDDLIDDTHLVHVMQMAAIRGSIGSTAVQIQVLKDRFFLTAHYTPFLTPKFDPDAPDTLICMTEKKKVLGSDLKEAGYQIDPVDLKNWFFFQRIWDVDGEWWYQPWSVLKDEDFEPVLDQARSVEHKLGLVPWVWIKNLPGPDGCDGACTFAPAITNCIQIDYALSRADRALKYNSDPLTVFKVRNPSQVADFIRSSGNAMVIGVEGDAKMLEISGDAAHAILDTVKELKDEALHAIHGNRANPDKLALSDSSLAQRLLYLPAIQLASALRLSYGDGGIVPIIKLMLQIASQIPVRVHEKMQTVRTPAAPIALTWSDFFPPGPADMQMEATTITGLFAAGLISRETALGQLGKFFDFGPSDVTAEIEKIKSDLADQVVQTGAMAKAEAQGQPKPAA